MLRYAVPVIAVHALALLALVPAFFSWTGVILCVAGVHVFGQTITMGYHRLLAHRSFRTPLWFEHLLVVGALCCLEDSPARWIATHRYVTGKEMAEAGLAELIPLQPLPGIVPTR